MVARIKQTNSKVKSTPDIVVAAYIRVSTEDQAESGLGLEAQLEQVKAMAVVKRWPVPIIYEDAGISGTTALSRRNSSKQLVQDIIDGKVQAVIVPSLDRIGRKMRVIKDFADFLMERDIKLISCKESLDTSTPQGYFVLTMFAAVAQLERDTISQRTKAALAVRGKKYGYKSGPLPLGYKRIGETIVVDEEQAKVVRRIFHQHELHISNREIARRLTIATSKHWYHSSVAVVLSSKHIYKGAAIGDSGLKWPRILR
jgi:site-specific DNA recombinase